MSIPKRCLDRGSCLIRSICCCSFGAGPRLALACAIDRSTPQAPAFYLSDGQGNSHISCVHLDMGGKIEAPSITHPAPPLIIHGRGTIQSHFSATITFSAG